MLWTLLLPAVAAADLLPPNADLAVPEALAEAGAEPAELELVRSWTQRDDRWRPAAATAAEQGVVEIDGIAAALVDALDARRPASRAAAPSLLPLADQLEPGTDACADTKHQYATGLGLVDRMLRDAEDRGERWTKREARDLRDSMDPALDAAAGALLDAAALARCRVEASLRRLDEAERAALAGRLFAATAPDAWPTDAERAELAATLGGAWERVDRGGLLLAGTAWAEAVATGAEQLAALPAEAWPAAPTILPTALGEVWLGSVANNSGTGDPVLLLDPGGDDTWRIGTSREGAWGAGAPPVRGWIDLGGDDVWQSGVAGAGGALFSVSAGVDRAGDDTHRGGDLSQGAAAFGVASWWDAAGEDRIAGGRASQGFGAFGVGLLRLDGAERDVVDAQGFSQGTGGPAGVGVLVGGPGDTAYALASGPERSWRGWGAAPGQGAAWGLFDGLGGGLGVLADPSGDDSYAGAHGVQGVAQLGGLGLLVDARGQDRYAAGDFAQAACARAGVGALLDADGPSLLAARELSQAAAAGPCLAVLGAREATPNSPDAASAWGSGIALSMIGPATAMGLPAELAPQRTSRLAGVLVDPLLADGAEAGGPSLIGAWTAARGGDGAQLEAALAALDPARPAEVAAARGRVDAAARTPGAREAAARMLAAAPQPALTLPWLAALARAHADVASLPALYGVPSQQLSSDDPRVRAAALSLAAAIAAAADTDADAEQRLPGLATDAAARMQRDDDPRVRAAAAELLGWIGGAGSASVLVEALDGPTRLLRGAAEDALERVIERTDGLGVARAVFPLASESGRARPAALRLLAATGHRDAWEVLAAALLADDGAVRRAAAEGALGLRDGASRKDRAAIDEALQPLIDDDRDPELGAIVEAVLNPAEN